MMFKKKDQEEFPSRFVSAPVPIVGDAGIASTKMGDGRVVPLVIIDASGRPDLVDLVNLHEKVPPGDVISIWGALDYWGERIALILRFERPMKVDLTLEFDIARNGAIVDAAIKARALYIQIGKKGDRFINTPMAPRIVIEIAAEMPKQKWEKLWTTAIRKKLRKEGVPRFEAKRRATEYIEIMRRTFSFAADTVRK